MSSIFVHDPQAVLPYGVDWSSWLAEGDTITASTWTVASGLTRGSDSKTDTAATVWLSGGEVGVDYQATNRITTAQQMVDERTITIRVRQR